MIAVIPFLLDRWFGPQSASTVEMSEDTFDSLSLVRDLFSLWQENTSHKPSEIPLGYAGRLKRFYELTNAVRHTVNSNRENMVSVVMHHFGPD